MKRTTCPLDCYDACSVIYVDNRLKGDPKHPLTDGYLCPNLNGFLKQDRIINARYKGKDISLDEALEILTETLRESDTKNSILFKGSGNFGKMQDVTNLFFSKYGSTLTKGSLCDGAGEAGIVEGRGVSLALPISEIKKSEVVVVWGRDITTTNSHMMDIIKDKTIIVIDPVKTKLAKEAEVHLQLRPRSDLYLAILWARFALLEEMVDYEFIESKTEEYDYFLSFLESFRINRLIAEVDLKVSQFLKALELMRDKKVCFLVGVGVQKYLHGDEVLRAIDSFAAILGLFAKDGCGVSYLSNSGYGFTDPFQVDSKRVTKPIVDFSEYEIVFIQGANPAEQMPDSNRVIEGLKRAKFVVYFGLYENETSKLADLILPAKSFLEKDDIRFSYGSEFVGLMPKLIDSDIGISEFDLTDHLFKLFGYGSLKDEKEYIAEILNSNTEKLEGYHYSKSYEKTPYSEGFYTDSGKFIFLDEVEDEKLDGEGFFLITSKSKHTINSQFKGDDYLYISENLDFNDGDMVEASSKYGSSKFRIKTTSDLRDDSIKITSGAKGLNSLTPSIKSNYGDSAVFQEVKISLKKV